LQYAGGGKVDQPFNENRSSKEPLQIALAWKQRENSLKRKSGREQNGSLENSNCCGQDKTASEIL
jgi:hypothetical protein